MTLAKARDMAATYRTEAKGGIDPIKQREKEKREAARNMHLLKDTPSTPLNRA